MTKIHLPHLLEMGPFAFKDYLFSGSNGILCGHKENWDIEQVLEKLALSFTVQSLCGGKVQGLPKVLAGRVCKVGPS